MRNECGIALRRYRGTATAKLDASVRMDVTDAAGARV